MIEKCTFGKMAIGGQTYRSDLMIYPDGRVVDAWRRASGHRLVTEDICALIAARPTLIVIGTGIYGRMRIAKELAGYLERKEIEIVADRTKKAAQLFNEARESRSQVGACFHLTC